MVARSVMPNGLFGHAKRMLRYPEPLCHPERMRGILRFLPSVEMILGETNDLQMTDQSRDRIEVLPCIQSKTIQWIESN